ncbi:MAG TPA: DNA methyltransferase [Anaerolineaceae bacterium]|jgi:DNA modification methylase|nr:MAG: DNA methylase [Pelotomaculum sp. PtaB.Bin013]HNZ02368.1 DNA methyltransferase [Anaerolineaceae bacterium]HOH21561.1 DNA methyltransferase [Anaerolineaceae bacterium]HOU44290.1 DNA methyltransferase [Anaerolineaceae bacterium]HQF45835.1 DNA methyltransferase [Anaerolineaceae bacterium]
MIDDLELVTLDEAAQIVGKTTHNIRDYIQRGRINKYNKNGELILKASNGDLRVSLKELKIFLSLVEIGEEKHHHAGLHPELGFYNLPEHQRTKHVHRLHPYLGKFIPQLVEWFLQRYFMPDAIILDPFMGSGTTLVQGNEMGMHTIGIDISPFNCLIAKVKTDKYNCEKARTEILEVERRVKTFSQYLTHSPAVNLLLFPDEKMEGLQESLLSECQSDYLHSWFAPRTLLEMLYYRRLIPHYYYQDLLKIVLSRAVRSSRLIPHYDLATPKAPLPVGEQYWCRKHNRFCTPIDNCIEKIHAYSEDTARRITEFDGLRSDKTVTIIQGDSRSIQLNEHYPDVLGNRLIDGIFTSPPYVGQIDYHDQHIYAYELFGFPRQDESEIGPKKSGKSKLAQNKYVEGIAEVFRNILPFVKPDGTIFIVANDRFDLYPEIARLSGMFIQEEFHRAVTKRTEQGNDPYQETIFMLKKEHK